MDVHGLGTLPGCECVYTFYIGEINMLKRLTFGTSLLLAPLAYQIHHYEEHVILNFRAWRLLYFPASNPLPTDAVLAIITALTLIYIIIYMLVKSRASAQVAILLLMATQVHNVIYHAGGTLYFRNFSPGLVTALAVYLPVNIIIANKALQEQLVTWKSLSGLFVLGGVLFWLFEFFGPRPMALFVVFTFICVAAGKHRDKRFLNMA
jgi:hypothetical protein